MNIALIISAGRGTRITSNIPKQFIKINGKEMLFHTVDVFEKSNDIDEIYVVTLKEYLNEVSNLAKTYNVTKFKGVIEGGKTRQDSVRNGLNSLNCKKDDIVFIHDGDRPFLDLNSIKKLSKIASIDGTAVLAVKESEGSIEGLSNAGRKATYDGVDYLIQTPQCFKYELIHNLHNRLKEERVSDDATLLDLVNIKINIVEGNKENIKITTDTDLEYLRRKLG